MTEQEKNEFEEFLKWKAEKNAKKSLEEKPGIANSGKSSQKSSKYDNIIAAIIVMVLMGIVVIIAAVANKNHQCSGVVTDVDSDSIVCDYYADIDSVAIVDTTTTDAAPAPAPGYEKTTTKSWNFSFEKDEMTDSRNIWASVSSDDFIVQDFPYEGCTYAKITVRYMRKYGYDVLVTITSGQISGNSYNGDNYIVARFDKKPPKRYYFSESADYSRDVVFIRNSSDFIKKCKSAKSIKLELPIYKAGRPVFSFSVDEPLKWREK